jgi:hypothetical protein
MLCSGATQAGSSFFSIYRHYLVSSFGLFASRLRLVRILDRTRTNSIPYDTKANGAGEVECARLH